MFAWRWPRQLGCGLALSILLIQSVWPFTLPSELVQQQVVWMTAHWGHPMALTLAHGALALMGMFPHSDFISMALPLDPIRHFLQEKGIAAWPFRFCLNIVALAIWVGLLNGLLGLSFGVIRLLHLTQGLKIISLKPQEEQPWEQAQRWPLWRRGLGVIPLVTLIWACADGLCFTPFVACIWIAMSYLLWWPFWGAREA